MLCSPDGVYLNRTEIPSTHVHISGKFFLVFLLLMGLFLLDCLILCGVISSEKDHYIKDINADLQIH